MTDPIGLYVHIPFCVKKCNYCDFCSFAKNEEERAKYVRALVGEIRSYRAAERIPVNTIFIGGGTPSLLLPEEFLAISSAIKESFSLAADTEFTVEVNPGTVSFEKLAAFRKAGVNRLSIGMQSIHENEQKSLGRIHNFEDFLSTYRMAREFGFDNINVDIMYGIPHQTLDSFRQTLEAVVALSPEHISCYGLIIEPGTPFDKMRETLPLPDEDEECDMYELACKYLAENDYGHYEISNYAKLGCECRHNLKYWHDEEYIGVGLSAHSYYLGERLYTKDSLEEYYSEDRAIYQYGDRIHGRDPFEYVMLAMRLREGLSLIKYEALFGSSFARGREHILKKYRNAGLLNVTRSAISFTERGFYLSNTILAELL